METLADAVRESFPVNPHEANPDPPNYDSDSVHSVPIEEIQRSRTRQVRKVLGLYASPRDGMKTGIIAYGARADVSIADSFRFVEVETRCDRNERDREESVAYTPYLGEWMTRPAAVTTASFGRDGRHLACPLQFYYSLLIPETTDNLNTPVAAVIATSHSRAMDWYGPVLVLKCRDRFMDSYVDIDQEDLRDIWFFFLQRL